MTSRIDSGLLFIAANDIDNNNTSVILIYKPRQSLRDSLIKVMIPKRQKLYIFESQMAAGGFNHQIFYLNDGDEHNLEWIDKQNGLTNIIIIKQLQIMRQINGISNLKQNPIIELSQAIVLYQTKSQIKFIQTNLNITNQKWIKDEIILNMVGTIFDYLLQCQQCGQGKNVNIIQPLTLFKQEYGDDLNVVDQIECGGQYSLRILLVSKSNLQAIRIYNSTNSFFKSIVISNQTNYKCEKVLKYLNHMIVACRNSQNYQMVTIWCDNETSCGNVIKYSDLTTNVKNIYSMNFDYKYLIVVDAHPKNLKSMDTYLRLFLVTFDDIKHTVTYSQTQSINTVQQYGEYLVKALLHHRPNYSVNTYILGLMSNGALKIYNSSLALKVSTINIYTEIINNGGEIIQKEFNDFFFTEIPTYSVNISTIHLLFTSQSLNYKFNLVYDTDNYKLKSIAYNYALSRYYDAQTLPGMWIDQYKNIASIPYRVNDKKVFLFFQLPDNSVNDKRIVYSYGGISEYHDFTYTDQVSCTIQKNVVILGVNSKYESNMFYIKYYDLQLKYTMIIDNSGGNLQNQVGSLELSNTICSEQLQFNIRIKESDQRKENSIK
ncbi:unnamed protein product [Paramecium pentaurelia]|uniref:Uncharacterized protein n=1 Tax=Paramecium pentaurelia TaxID=43138 RepID=A0A8S1XZ89_9CILI|nr:unnamed protein product [Paramecium pentaurelia]